MINRLSSLKNIALIGAMFVTVLVYWPGLSGPFLLDDNSNIQASFLDEPSWSSIIYTATHNESGLLGRSVTILSFMLTEWQFGQDAWGYKFHNLLLHVANGFLLYRLLCVLLPLLDLKSRPSEFANIAAVTAAFWLIHPLLVSTVLYAVQRMVELAVFFSLLALLSYLSARARPVADSKFIIYGWICFPLMLLLAVLSKETGVLIPVYILVIEYIAYPVPRNTLPARHHLGILLTFVIAPITLAGLYLISHFDYFTNFGSRTFTLYERLLTQLHVLAHYARSILFPRLKEMSLFQDDFPVTASFDPMTTLLLGILCLTVFVIWYLRYRAPVVAFGLAWFLASHLLESTFIPLELVFEHRNYLGAAGLLLPFLYYALKIQRKDLKVLRWLTAIFFVVIAGQTYSRVQEWSNQGIMLTVAVADHPGSARARTEYANYLYHQGKRDEAVEELRITIGLNQRDAGPVIHEMLLLCASGKRAEGLLSEAQNRLNTWPASAYAVISITTMINLVRNGGCKQFAREDIKGLLSAALSQPGNLNIAAYHASLLEFSGTLKFDEGLYREGADLFMQADALNADITRLDRLFRMQTLSKQYEDAQDTFDLMEERNEQHFGLETHLLNKAWQFFEESRGNTQPAG